MNKTLSSSSYLYLILLLIGLQTSKTNGDESTEQVTITDDTTEAFTEQQNIIQKIANEDEIRDNDEMEIMQRPYDLPADSESIRPNIIDSQFKCDEKEPGYYADVENECQIFHRCLEGRSEVYSFICPEQTLFDQRVLVCIWENNYDFDCSESAKYYHESNRAFFGNMTAEENMMENVMNSHEFRKTPTIVQRPTISPFFYNMNNNEREEFKIYDSSHQTTEESGEMEETSEQVIDDSTSQFNSVDYQAELIPTSSNHFDASIATSLDSINSLPQKVSLFVDEPIIEFPAKKVDEMTMTDGRRNIRKRSKIHRNRFLFKADTAALAH